MTWRNIFDLGDVDLYFVLANEQILRPLSELPSGTVTVLNGVIQCRDLPNSYAGQGVRAIVAIPRSEILAPLPYRMTFANASIPRVSQFSLDFTGAASRGQVSAGAIDFDPSETVYDWNAILDEVDTADFVPNPALGSFVPATPPDESALYFRYDESEA